MRGPAPRDTQPAGVELSADAILPPSGVRPFPFLSPPRGGGEIGWLGDYRVLRVLGAGGAGVVFEAEDPDLHRRVAVKVLRPEQAADPESRERFLREGRAAASLRDDHVVTVYRVGEAGGVPFLAMQLLPGESLQDRLREQPPLGVTDALRVARDAARGLAAAHAAGLIHRDVKPANIWLEADGTGGGFRRARLLDFGLARRTEGETSLTATGLIVGTPNYMAPEQASGLPTDHRADLFSLGVVLYTMLTGELPFPGESALAVMVALTTKDAPPIRDKNPDVPQDVADLVGRLLEKDPAARVQSASGVIVALDAILAGLPAQLPARATPPGRTGLSDTVGRARADTVGPTGPYTPVRRPSGRALVAVAAGALALGLLAGVGWRLTRPERPEAVAPPVGEPIKVGVLHSRTGTMAVSELPLIDATVLAVEELNRAGGVLGRPVQAVVADGRSDTEVFASEAVRLIHQEKVVAIFGCMMSPSRKAVREVVERDNGLLFYPVSYEGLEESPRIVYTGAAPNQKLLPSVDYLIGTLGKRRLFIIGSDLVSPRAATEVIRDHVRGRWPDAAIVGEKFIPLGSADVGPLVDAIEAARPDAVLNILNGSSFFHFYREFRKRKFTPAALPTMSIAMTEHDLRGLDPREMAGDYLAANYFRSLDREESRAFIARVRERFGADRVVTDNMVAAYTGVHLWARAAERAGRPDPEAVTRAVGGVEYAGPGGLLRVDPENRHVWRPWRVGQVQADGSVKVVAESAGGVRADPFPATRTRADWERLLNDLFVEWNGHWHAPIKP